MAVVCFNGILINIVTDSLLMLEDVGEWLDDDSQHVFFFPTYAHAYLLDLNLNVLCSLPQSLLVFICQ
jgi:hypothetical protein